MAEPLSKSAARDHAAAVAVKCEECKHWRVYPGSYRDDVGYCILEREAGMVRLRLPDSTCRMGERRNHA